MVKVIMVLFLMPKEPNSTEGYESYGALFIHWLNGYLDNYIACLPLQYGDTILE